MIGDSDSSKNEFVELFNDSDAEVILDGYKLVKKTENGNEFSNLLSSKKFGGVIGPKGYFTIAHPQYKNSISADASYSGASYSIASSNTVALFDESEQLVDLVGYGEAKNFEGSPAINPGEGQSIGRINGADTDNNSEDFYILQSSSPGTENFAIENDQDDAVDENENNENPVDEESPEEIPAENISKNLRINEILPSPKGSDAEGEYVELYNFGSEEINLKGWKIKDRIGESENDKWKIIEIKEDLIILAGEYLKIDRSRAKFSLTNSDKIILLSPSDEEIDAVEYSEGKEDAAYCFDGKKWRWGVSSPGKENVFENYSYPAVKITAVNPNPKGVDSKLETITIKNNSKEEINLLGWSIATGWEKLYNHPINLDFEIKPGKEKELTRKFSAFTLNNKKTKIELRYPDGKVAYEMKYKNKEGIKEGEFYVKKKKGGWKWIVLEQESEKDDQKNSAEETAEKIVEKPIVVIKKQEIVNDIGKLSQEEKENLFEKIEKDNLKGEILKKESDKRLAVNENEIRVENKTYRFTKDHPIPPHYAKVFLNKATQNINSKLNAMLNYLLSS
ncbi:MAG: Extracellular nuclease [uncultured bacterium]|nr:MAG: Extracellular nuclease [uncultured bacterium]